MDGFVTDELVDGFVWMECDIYVIYVILYGFVLNICDIAWMECEKN